MRIHARRAMLALSAITFVTASAYANHSWGNYHWAHQADPVQLRIERQITAKWESAFNTAVSDWEAKGPLSLTAAGSNAGVSSKKCTAITGKILVCNDHYGQRGWLGIASIWADGQSHITKATTKLNDSYFDSGTYNTPAWIALVTCQEIGHDFGLGHQDENFNNANLNTCMDYTNNPTSNQHPNQHDYDLLTQIYGHTDSYDTAILTAAATNFGVRTTGKPAAAGSSANDPGDSPAEWGSAVHRDGKGRPDIYVQRQPGGLTKITHVLWAPDHKSSH